LGAEPPVRAPPPLRGAMPTVETAVEEEEDVTFESETKVELKVEDEAKDEDEEDEEEQEEKGEAAEEAAAAAPTKPKKEPLRPKKEQRPKPPLAAAKVTTATSLATKKAMNGSRSEHELFVERKRTELTMRDTACKAICKIKYGLRQPGAQEDGRPVIPEDWEKLYKPMLGSYIKFLLSRPDQFRVVEGSGPGFYTIEDVTLNKTAVAPVKGKDKGKGKGKRKGPTGPNQPRARITKAPVTGEVLEWKGKYGWVQPTTPIEHEMAQRHGGRIYVSMSDLQNGLTELTPGTICQFHVFSDASGLGCEECIGS